MHYEMSTFHAFLDDQLSSEEASAFATHLSQCLVCQQQLSVTESSVNRVTSALKHLHVPVAQPPVAAEQLTRLKRRLQAEDGSLDKASPAPSLLQVWLSGLRLLWRTPWLLPTAVAMLLVAVGLGTSGSFSGVEQPDTFIAKGDLPQFRMLHARASLTGSPTRKTARVIEDGAIVAPGDFVQFQYSLAQDSHAMIVGIHEKGSVFPYAPLQGSKSILLRKGRGLMPQRILLELDDTLGAERFVMVVAARPFTVDELRRVMLRAWQANGKDVRRPLSLPKEWLTRSVWVEKRKQQRPGASP